jgi:CRISPR-associated protein Cas1
MGRTVLGLDLGPNSIGWALVLDDQENESRLVDTGVRVFTEGLDKFDTGKVRRQADNLPADYPAFTKLRELARRVRAGDPENIEAQAAKVYWQNWLWPDEFRRNYNADGLNGFLNYGYAVVRAACARAIVAAGLIPSLGIHHCHRANAFSLADDLMEPFRPWVDERVREMFRAGYECLDQHAKACVSEILTTQTRLGDETGPFMTMLHRYINSLVKCYEGTTNRLSIPQHVD